MMLLVISLLSLLILVQASPKHIVMIVADDLGRNDLGIRNAKEKGPRTVTPNIDALITQGITLDAYHTFKICGPSRASTLTGRYPWGAGFYDMNQDNDHTTTNFTLYPALLQAAGYRTHALGKWDVGWMARNATSTYRGFDDFYGYYLACNADYWYHTVAGGAKTCAGSYNSSVQDWSDNVNTTLSPGDRIARNGTYNQELLTGRAENIIASHDSTLPLYLYLAYQNVHEGCARDDALGMQAPLASVTDHYNTTVLDTYKLMGGMLTELDTGVGRVVAALKQAGLFESTLLVFVSDNGGPLEHSTNFPLRGGKHTFYDGGLKVEAFLAGGAIPPQVINTTWYGLAHASDWYLTLLEGYAGITVNPSSTGGPRPLDSLNLWSSIMSNSVSPRNEIIHQVNNSYFDEGASALRIGDMKLVRGLIGDNRTLAWPEKVQHDVPWGLTGAVLEEGTDHLRSTVLGGQVIHHCTPYCLWNITSDPGENFDLAEDPKFNALAAAMISRLDEAGRTGPPNAYIWDVNSTAFHKAVQKTCLQGLAIGSIQPVDY